MKSVAVSVLAVMVLAGSALAAIPNTTEYLLATQPFISGKVASANDHMMIVDTDQHGRVALTVDSKTMLPTDFAPGMAMRVEFKAMPDGHYYARRVTPIRDGMSTERGLAYARTGGRGMTQYAASHASMEGGRSQSLPQTASPQPLILMLGLLALASAGVLAVSRRLRRA